MEFLKYLFIACFLVIGLLLLLAPSKRSEIHKDWSLLATRTGLVFFGNPFPTVNGTYRGRKVSLALKTERTIMYDAPYTEEYIRVWIGIISSNYGTLSLTERFSFSNTFDSRFHIQSEPVNFASHIFSSPELRQKLLMCPLQSIVISQAKLGLESKISGSGGGVDHLQLILDTLCDVAEAVEEPLFSGYVRDPSDHAAA